MNSNKTRERMVEIMQKTLRSAVSEFFTASIRLVFCNYLID